MKVDQLASLRSAVAKDPKLAIKEVAKQFEGLFMQELMKSMRQATMTSGMLDNEGTKLGSEMLDTQLSTQMTGLPGGLADAIARQLERQMNFTPDGAGRPGHAAPNTALNNSLNRPELAELRAGPSSFFACSPQLATTALSCGRPEPATITARISVTRDE